MSGLAGIPELLREAALALEVHSGMLGSAETLERWSREDGSP